MNILRGLFNRFESLNSARKIFLFRKSGIVIASLCTVEKEVSAYLGISGGVKGRIKINMRTQLCQGVILNCWGGSISIAENVFIGPYTVIYGHGGVTIGKDTLISMHCRILSSNHTIPTQKTRIRSQPDILLPTDIGEDVWLGAGVTVLGGVTIGDGCVVGAGAVVTKDLPPYSIALGVPAQVVGMRE